MIWSKWPKRVLFSKSRLVISVCESIIKWNEGADGRKSFLESLNVKCCPNVIAGLRNQNSLRLSNARRKITEKYKKRRQVLRQLRKQNKKGIPHVDFQQKLPLMLILQAMDQFTKYKQDVCKTITFVSDVHNKWYFTDILLFFYCITICKYCLLYLYFIKTIESNTQLIPYFTLNWISQNVHFSSCEKISPLHLLEIAWDFHSWWRTAILMF